MTRSGPGECSQHSPGPDHPEPRNPQSENQMTNAKANTKKPKSEAIALRDALPFFKKGRGKVATSWWNVTPSGDYATDLKTGKNYARAFLPMLTFNGGASALGAIVSDMAKAGR